MLQAAKRELERQRQLEWERNRRQELLNQRNKEQEDIVVLKAKKKTLEFELEALVSERVSIISALKCGIKVLFRTCLAWQIILVKKGDIFLFFLKNDKKNQLEGKLQDIRCRLSTQRQEIESTNKSRELRIAEITHLQQQLQVRKH